MRDEASKVGTPLPKIVVDVNRRNAGLVSSVFECGDLLRRRQCMSEDWFCAFEFEIIDYVDQEQDDRRIVGSVAV